MALRFLYSDYESDYGTLLTKAGKSIMNVYRLKVICTEIYKSLNSFSPVFIKDIFKPNTSSRSLRAQQQHNLKTPSPNQTTFGTKSLTSLKFGTHFQDTLKISKILSYSKKQLKTGMEKNVY